MIYKIPNKYSIFLVLLCFIFLYFFVLFINKEEIFYVPKYIPKNKEYKIIFFGDLMLDRGVKRKIDKEGIEAMLSSVSKEIYESDIAVANLEGVFSSNESVSLEDRNILRFTFDKKLAINLSSFGFDILSQANNHSADFGMVGLDESRKIIKENNMEFLGDYWNLNPGPIIKELGNKKIAFLAFNQFGGSVDNVKNNLNSISDEYIKIVFCHWGDEYKKIPSEKIRQIAHELVSSGADVIIGAHPHVIQPIEIFNNSIIFYSLGNFVFDQDFSKETTEGLSVEMVLNKKEIKFNLIPFNINASVPLWKDNTEKKEVLDFLFKNSFVSDMYRKQIREGYLIVN